MVLAEAVRSAGEEVGPEASLRTLSDGQTLLGRYQVRRFIARGGMGEVYEAVDSLLGERVALKTLLPTALDDDRAMKRLLAEVRLARKVSHPNVCRILEVDLFRQSGAPGLPFLTMAFLSGESLSDRIAARGPLEPATVVNLVAGMTAGLAAVHAAGIVHRDLKSANVFLVPDAGGEERAVIMDFGLAQSLADGARLGSSSIAAGTPDYMAPEQVEGQPATPASDIYALGVVIFEMLTGRRPFADGSPYVTALNRLRRRAPSPSSLVRGLAPVWDAVVGRCLERLPQRRFARIEEVTAALAGGPLRGSRGKRLAAALAVAGGVLAVAARLASTSHPPPAAVRTPNLPPSPAGVPPATVAAGALRRAPAPPTRPIRERPRQRKNVAAPSPGATAQSLLHQAQSVLVAGDVARACRLGEQAAALSPALSAAQLFLGKCFVRLGDPDRARDHYRRYLLLTPDAPDGVFVRAILDRPI